MKRILAALAAASGLCLVAAAPAWACGGLVNPNGTVTLVRTTTLAGYRYGVEHYVTSFKFEGGGAKFGSIVPLPGVPSKLRRAGDWTLQRLAREVAPPAPLALEADSGTSRKAKVIMEKEIDSVKLTVLKGGGDAVGRWAKNNGFVLPADAPEVLDFYAARSPIFMAVRFDPKDAKATDKQVGDGVPIHLNIRTDNPWVPLRILGLGQDENTIVEADVFLLTKRRPQLAPAPDPASARRGLILSRSEAASRFLLKDLRSDKGGMQWVHPSSMWLTYLQVRAAAGDLVYDLATDVRGGTPSEVAAGLREPKKPQDSPANPALWSWGAASIFGFVSIVLTNRLIGGNQDR